LEVRQWHTHTHTVYKIKNSLDLRKWNVFVRYEKTTHTHTLHEMKYSLDIREWNEIFIGYKRMKWNIHWIWENQFKYSLDISKIECNIHWRQDNDTHTHTAFEIKKFMRFLGMKCIC